MTSDLVETLIDTHGEDGAAPTREEWEKILALPGDEAVLILNLLSFVPETGMADYGRYMQGVDPSFARAGGKQVFFGPAECDQCHLGALLTDQRFHNTAVPQIGPGHPLNAPFDYGRENVDTSTTSRFAFRTPPLRNVARTAPYMHNGSLLELGDVLGHYADPLITARQFDPSVLHPDLRGTVQMDETHVDELLSNLSEDLNLEADGRTFVGLSNIRQFLVALTDPAYDDLPQIVPSSVPSGLPVPSR